MSARTAPGRTVQSINTILLSNGQAIHIDDIATPEQGQAALDDVDETILRIEGQLEEPHGGAREVGADWRRRAERALQRKRKLRPRLERRISELRQAAKVDAATASARAYAEKVDGKRGAFVKAAYEVLGHEVCTEVWARAQEMRPEIFTDGQVPA